MKVRGFVFILGVLLMGGVLASEPVLLFSDLTDGVVSGGHWGGAQEGRGAAVSVWGRNLGSVRGSSYVSVGGVDLKSDSDYAEWGVTENPHTASGQERITFWLNENMTLGDSEIKVTTSEGVSLGVPFYLRDSGNIYFVSKEGDDNNTGLDNVNQMWESFYKVRITVQAGDVAYFREGLWAEEDKGAGHSSAVLKLYDLGSMPEYGFNDGIANNSISLVSYPGEMAQIGRGLDSDALEFIYRYDDAGSDGLNFWTISKFKVNVYDTNMGWNAAITANKDNSLRIIGNDMTSTDNRLGHGNLIDIFSNANDIVIYGNYLHGAGKVHDTDATLSKKKAIYFAGGGASDGLYIGWNELTHNSGHSQFFGHFRTDHLDNLKFHDNFVHEEGQQVIVFGGGDPQSDPQYDFLGEGIKIYNNIFANNDGHVRFSNSANGLSGYFEVYQNTFYNNAQSFGHSELLLTQYEDAFNFHHNIVDSGPDSSNPQYWDNHPAGYDYAAHSNNEVGDHNLWHGHGAGPSWSTSDWDDVAPEYVVEHPVKYEDFRLKNTSPVYGEGVGVQIGSFEVLGEYCGDAICNNGENCTSCSVDCGNCTIEPFCGDDVCDVGENCTSCFEDCGNCSSFHEADLDESGVVETSELVAYVERWKVGEVSVDEVMEVVSLWGEARS